MHNKLLIIFLLSLFPIIVSGQWRVGVTGGATLNHYTIDKHYMDDWHYDDGWGATFGIMGQYDFLEWNKWQLGIRAELNWTQKNYEGHHSFRGKDLNGVEKNYMYISLFHTNNYIQLPVMVSACYGKKFKCFVNLGVFGGHWTKKKASGYSAYGIGEVPKDDKPSLFVAENEFDSSRDQRLDFGLVGGIGAEWLCWEHIAFQIEIRDYYSVTSTQKDYMRIKDPRYNNTVALQGGICWVF